MARKKSVKKGPCVKFRDPGRDTLNSSFTEEGTELAVISMPSNTNTFATGAVGEATTTSSQQEQWKAAIGLGQFFEASNPSHLYCRSKDVEGCVKELGFDLNDLVELRAACEEDKKWKGVAERHQLRVVMKVLPSN